MNYTLPLSVIVPAYNHAQYIAAAIQSIASQDYPDLEIVVVDDGSTDGTGEVAQKALEQGGRPYRLVRQANAGAHAALNRGIQIAKGEYLAILNSDDCFLPGRLRTMVNALDTAQRRFAFSKVAHIDPQGNPHPYQQEYLRQLDAARQFPTLNFEFLRHNIAATTGNFVFHRSLYDEIGGFSAYTACHDWDYILRVLRIEEPLFVDETLLEYRIHPQGALQQNLDLVNAEIEQIMLDYLAKAPAAKNPLAPGPAHWGYYWDFFCNTGLERIRAFPRVQAHLAALKARELTPKNEEIPSHSLLNPIEIFGPLNFSADLDLTQLTMRIPPVNKEEKNSRRLLFILPWMVMGGAERFALNVIDQLRQRQWQVTIVCTSPSENGWYGEFARRTNDIFVLPDIIPVKEYVRFFRYLCELRDFDAALVQGSIESYRLLPALHEFLPHLPILDYLHFVTPDWMDGGFPRLSYLYRDGIDATITSCEQVKEWMVQEGAGESRLRVCPIGVDAECWKPDALARTQVRKKLEIREDEVVLVYAARLEAQKQPFVLLETLRRLSQRGVAYRALVAGDGSLRHELEQKIQLYGLGEIVNLLGSVPSGDMPALLAAGDIFFLPSQNEGISSAIYEAMASGLPVVGVDVGGQAELVTPQCGFLIPKVPNEEQPEVYARVLIELIQDEPKRRSMGSASREHIISHFTLHHMGECISGVIEEVIDLKRKGMLVPFSLSEEERFTRDTQHVVEYLQARQEWRSINQRHVDLMRQHEDLSRKYFELLQPKPPSHWFYLWIRQLFLPVFKRFDHSRLGQSLVAIQKSLKNFWIKE